MITGKGVGIMAVILVCACALTAQIAYKQGHDRGAERARLAAQKAVDESLDKFQTSMNAILDEAQRKERENKARLAVLLESAVKPKQTPLSAGVEQLLPAPAGRIEDLAITNSLGDVFTNLKLNKVTADGLLFEHSHGLVKAKWTELPAWCRDKYRSASRAASLKPTAGASRLLDTRPRRSRAS
jgi:hypothetical protein